MEIDHTPLVHPHYATPSHLVQELTAYAHQRSRGGWGRDSIVEVTGAASWVEEISADTADEFADPEEIWEIAERNFERSLASANHDALQETNDEDESGRRACVSTTEIVFRAYKTIDDTTSANQSDDTPAELVASYTLEYDLAQKLSYDELEPIVATTIIEDALADDTHVLHENIEDDNNDPTPESLRRALKAAHIERFNTANYAISALGNIAISEIASGYRIEESDVITDSYRWVNPDTLDDPTDHKLSPEENLMNQLMNPGEAEHIRRALGILSLLSGTSYAVPPSTSSHS